MWHVLLYFVLPLVAYTINCVSYAGHILIHVHAHWLPCSQMALCVYQYLVTYLPVEGIFRALTVDKNMR